MHGYIIVYILVSIEVSIRATVSTYALIAIYSYITQAINMEKYIIVIIIIISILISKDPKAYDVC